MAKQEQQRDFVIEKCIFGFKSTSCQNTVTLSLSVMCLLKPQFFSLRSKDWGFLGGRKI